VTEQMSLLVTHLERYVGLEEPAVARCQYMHMGATICDAILQAGLNYRAVVAPRVTRMMQLWPLATTTSLFTSKADRYGLNDVLQWQDAVKLFRIERLALFMLSAEIETEANLREFFLDEERAETLRSVPGVGPKTFDYLKLLVGMPTLAVDRHVRALLERAGVPYTGYADAQALMLGAAERLGVDPGVLDGKIWAAASRQYV
jgi:hypothetical protein